MKTITVSEFERELPSLFEAVRNGERVTLQQSDKSILIVPDEPRSRSPEMLTILNKPFARAQESLPLKSVSEEEQ